MEKKEKKSFGQKIKELLTAKSVGGIIVRIIILLAIPYAYLLLCGLIFDKWLRMYQMTTFIFISLCVLYVIAIILCILTIKWSNEAMKGGKKKHRKAAPKKEAQNRSEEATAETVKPENPEEQVSELTNMAEALKQIEEPKTEE